MKAKSENKAAQSCPTCSDPRDCSLRGSSVHGIFQARVLEWVAISFSVDLLLVANSYRALDALASILFNFFMQYISHEL